MKKILRPVNAAFDLLFIALMILLLLFVGYAQWDSRQVYTSADPVQYIQYKPSPPEMVSFEELQGINPDVLGWLTIYDTNIDYPLVVGEDNEHYLNHNPKDEPESAGSLFLDYRNSKDFSDFNTIIFGHHMSHHKMFGDLDEFLEEDFWNTHEYGNLVYNGENHGLQFVAMLQCDAYDFLLYKPGVKGETTQLRYINRIYETAKYVRGVPTETLRAIQKQAGDELSLTRTSPVTPNDRLLLLSTCSAETTNGRFILVAKLLDESVENPFPDSEEHKVSETIDGAKLTETIGKWSTTQWILFLIILILIVMILYLYSNYRYKKQLEGEKQDDENHS